jgi:hypothetical protein
MGEPDLQFIVLGLCSHSLCVFIHHTCAEANTKISQLEIELVSGTRPVNGILLRQSVIVLTNGTEILD